MLCHYNIIRTMQNTHPGNQTLFVIKDKNKATSGHSITEGRNLITPTTGNAFLRSQII